MKYNEDSLPWNNYDKIIKQMPDKHKCKDFLIQYGDCNHHNDTTIFRFLFINQRTNDYYRFSFNSKWCPEKDKGWLMDVLSNQFMTAINEATNHCQDEIKHSVNNILSNLNSNIKV